MKLDFATADEKRARDRLAYESWGDLLTTEQYLQREARLCAHPWARETKACWVWRDGDGAILSSCETYRMCSAVDGVRGETWGVASVFTEPALRGRGHATRLMDLVIKRVRHDSPAAHAMLLFSDVGAAIYERSGYRTRPADDLLFPPAPGALAADALLDETEALAAFSTLEPPPEPFVIWPARDQLDWHLERARTYAALLGRPLLPHAGARIGDSVIVWAADWKHDRLQVLLLASSRGHEAEALVRAARRCAAAADLNEVRLWAEPWDFVGRDDLGGDRVARRDSLPMLAPLLPSLRPEMWRRIPRAVWM